MSVVLIIDQLMGQEFRCIEVGDEEKNSRCSDGSFALLILRIVHVKVMED